MKKQRRIMKHNIYIYIYIHKVRPERCFQNETRRSQFTAPGTPTFVDIFSQMRTSNETACILNPLWRMLRTKQTDWFHCTTIVYERNNTQSCFSNKPNAKCDRIMPTKHRSDSLARTERPITIKKGLRNKFGISRTLMKPSIWKRTWKHTPNNECVHEPE